ncbi:hypothetical protein B0H66DRAFT_546031 [Apodospora peruviana]|uniref:PPPDE domain-containing protein n=1 Tax=Apodospora peruviana TaxID=516989 RepID=A0AAE0MHH2_9PEZI|nr:hypothetical protein B0H66DRAFT_546031 [Apodospora peruviana]
MTRSATPETHEEEDHDEHHSKRDKMKSLWKGGLEKGKTEILKGRHKLEAALGLGHKPNVIPPGVPDIHAEHRPVYIGWHPVAGFAGSWFAEKTGLGKKITEKIHSYPDPTQHWAVLVGDYCHELWMDEHLHVIYINERVNHEEWHKYEVGKTSFNDEALRQAGEMVIYNMREKKPAYNLISNNCQNFAILMLDAIQVGMRREFATSYAVFQRATGAGTIADLFAVTPEEEAADAAAADGQHEEGVTSTSGVVQHAQQVMDEHTTKLDNHQSYHVC